MAGLLRGPWLERYLLELLDHPEDSRVPFVAKGYLQPRTFHNYRFEEGTKEYSPEELIMADISDKYCMIKCVFTLEAERNFSSKQDLRLTQLKGAILSKVKGFLLIKEAEHRQGLCAVLEIHSFKHQGDLGGAIFGEPDDFELNPKAERRLNNHYVFRLVGPHWNQDDEIISQASRSSSPSEPDLANEFQTQQPAQIITKFQELPPFQESKEANLDSNSVSSATKEKTVVKISQQSVQEIDHEPTNISLEASPVVPRIATPLSPVPVAEAVKVPDPYSKLHRRRLHTGWADFQNLSYYDCQIPSTQQKVLDDEKCWRPKGEYEIPIIQFRRSSSKSNAIRSMHQNRLLHSAEIPPVEEAENDHVTNRGEAEDRGDDTISWPASPEPEKIAVEIASYGSHNVSRHSARDSPPPDSSPEPFDSPVLARNIVRPDIPPPLSVLASEPNSHEVDDLGSTTEPNAHVLPDHASRVTNSQAEVADASTGYMGPAIISSVASTSPVSERAEPKLSLEQRLLPPLDSSPIQEYHPKNKLHESNVSTGSNGQVQLGLQIEHVSPVRSGSALTSPPRSVSKTTSNDMHSVHGQPLATLQSPGQNTAHIGIAELSSTMEPSLTKTSEVVNRTLPWRPLASQPSSQDVSPMTQETPCTSQQYRNPYDIAARKSANLSPATRSQPSRPWQTRSASQLSERCPPILSSSHVSSSGRASLQNSTPNVISQSSQKIGSGSPNPYIYAARGPRVRTSLVRSSPSQSLSREIWSSPHKYIRMDNIGQSTPRSPSQKLEKVSQRKVDSYPSSKSRETSQHWREHSVSESQITDCAQSLSESSAIIQGGANDEILPKVIKFDLSKLRKTGDGLNVGDLLRQDRAQFLRFTNPPPVSIESRGVPPVMASYMSDVEADATSSKRKAEEMEDDASDHGLLRIAEVEEDTALQKLLSTTFRVREPKPLVYDILNWARIATSQKQYSCVEID